MMKSLKNNKKNNLNQNVYTEPVNLAKKILIDLIYILAASVLFAACFPNLLFENGLPILAWFAYIPILLVIQRNGLLQCAGWGAVYGFLSYALFNYWLGAFHPLAGIIVYAIYLVYLAVVFLLMKLAEILYPRRFYMVQWVIWLAYEYLRTTGFLGYPYGITGYSQWRMLPIIQIASITGVWGVSALVAFPSFWLAAAIKGLGARDRGLGNVDSNQSEKKHIKLSNNNPSPKPQVPSPLKNNITSFFKKEKISAIIWITALIATLIFGIVSLKDFSSSPKVNIALIQHNIDPWEASKASTYLQRLESYRRDLTILKRLSDEALAGEIKPDMVVWPETAFVPRIHWHSTYREDQGYWLLVRDLLEYLSTKDVPFLIGNDDARREPDKNPDPSESHRVDYNAAMLFENGQISKIYRKLHLVPFTEHFPYKKQFPIIHQWLRDADTHFWEKGNDLTVFTVPASGGDSSFNFSSPICFEDSFGYLSRNFVKHGADVLVNLTNDAWSQSLPAQNQHLSAAVFRSVENSRSMVRSAVSGQTCAIDPAGRVTAMAQPFTEAWLTAEVPIVNNRTIYTLYGDYLAFIFVILAVFLLLSKAVWCTIKKGKKR